MRRFFLERTEDVHGNSGTGVVAQGVQFDNGLVALTWLTPFESMTFFQSIEALKKIHGHNGKNTIVWIDKDEENCKERLFESNDEIIISGSHENDVI